MGSSGKCEAKIGDSNGFKVQNMLTKTKRCENGIQKYPGSINGANQSSQWFVGVLLEGQSSHCHTSLCVMFMGREIPDLKSGLPRVRSTLKTQSFGKFPLVVASW